MTSDGVSYTKNGETITVKKALDELITKSSKVDELEKQVADYKSLTIYLADNVQVGDYVDYDAGDWKASAKMPTEQGQFGGNVANTNKGTSVACFEDTVPKYNGWRVLSIDKNTKTVTLVHAGQPECYYHGDGGYSATSIELLMERGSQYVNGSYATKGRSIIKEDAEKIAETSDLRKTGARYWLANAYSNEALWDVYEAGIFVGNFDGAFGFRPVVELKPNIKTTGKGTDEFGQEAWTLVPQQ